ncbi:50S ribosomal protein L23 [Leptothermofonsia sp. ETS-13]|uniref:50S ribosomal protein L23 n=1 Tax=Leptothermofonsia sp. ETS-13 TaxID=3035696 RepID=UPI003B9DF90D
MTEFDPRNLADLIRRPIVTEKATLLLENNQYTFEVSPKATKPEIKAAVESLFDVKVVAVKTQNPPRKTRRVGKFMGHRALYKRAIVTLAAGDSITLFPEV